MEDVCCHTKCSYVCVRMLLLILKEQIICISMQLHNSVIQRNSTCTWVAWSWHKAAQMFWGNGEHTCATSTSRGVCINLLLLWTNITISIKDDFQNPSNGEYATLDGSTAESAALQSEEVMVLSSSVYKLLVSVHIWSVVAENSLQLPRYPHSFKAHSRLKYEAHTHTNILTVTQGF